MVNAIFVDIDTERDRQIIFSKPQESTPPQNAEEAAKMIIMDIACLSEAVKVLIDVAVDNNYGKREELVKAAITTIQSTLI